MAKGFLYLVLLLGSVDLAEAQQPTKTYRVGVIHQGGPFYTVIEGLRDGLREWGFEEGKHFALQTRDVKGDLNIR